MSMVGGLDLHRRQITYDVLDVESGEIWRGRLWQPDRARFRNWLENEVTLRAHSRRGRHRRRGLHRLALRHRGDLKSRLHAVLGRTGRHAGGTGKKHHAKTDRSDARLLRDVAAPVRRTDSLTITRPSLPPLR